MANNELRHYGILGMRWGIRRKRLTAPSKTAAESVTESTKSKINRKNLEKKYKSLEPSSIAMKETTAFVSDVLKEIGKNTVTNLGSQFDEEASKSAMVFVNRVINELEGRKKN